MRLDWLHTATSVAEQGVLKVKKTILVLSVFVISAVAQASHAAKAQPTCSQAYRSAMASPKEIVLIVIAQRICEEARDAQCANYVAENSDGPDTGDCDYASALCTLRASIGANTAVHQGRLTQVCQSAFASATNSGARYDLFGATQICDAETSKECASRAEINPNGILENQAVVAMCGLQVRHGAYREVSKRK